MLARSVRLGVQIVPHGVGLFLPSVLHGGGRVVATEVQIQRGKRGRGDQLARKVAVRRHLPLAVRVALVVQINEEALLGAAVLPLVLHLSEVGSRQIDSLSIVFRLRQRNERRCRVIRHLVQLHGLPQRLKVAFVLQHDHQAQIALRGGCGGAGSSFVVNYLIETLAAGQCRRHHRDTVCADRIETRLHHGDAHLLLRLSVIEGCHHHRHGGSRRLQAPAAAGEPLVLLDLALQRPSIIDVLIQMEGSAEVVGDNVVNAVVGREELPLVGHTAVHAHVVPRGGHRVLKGRALRHVHGSLRTEDKVHLRVEQLLSLQNTELYLPQPLGDLHRRIDLAPAVQLDIRAVGVLVVVQSAKDAGLGAALHLEEGVGLLGCLQLYVHAAAGTQTGILPAQIAASLALQLQAHTELLEEWHLGDGHIRSLVFQNARAHGGIRPALDDLHIVALHRHLHPDGRDGDKVAVDGVGKPVEAASAALDKRGGHRRDDGDAARCGKLEIQVVGRKPPVVQPLQLQLRLRLKEFEGIQLQLEVVLLLPVEGIDGGLQLSQIQPQQVGTADLSLCLNTVLLELVVAALGAVAQLFQRDQLIGGAVQNEIQPHMTGQHHVARPLQLRLIDMAADLRDVHKHQHGVLLRLHVQRQLLAPVEVQSCRLCHAGNGAVQLKGGRVVLYPCRGVKAGESSVAVHSDLEMLSAVPGRGDGGRQSHLSGGKFIEFPPVVTSLLEVAPQRIQRRAVLLFQNLLPRRIPNGQCQHTAAGLVNAQLVGILRDDDLVRPCEVDFTLFGGLRLGIHIPVPPDMERAPDAAVLRRGRELFRISPGGQNVLLRVVSHKGRCLCFIPADILIVHQHKGVIHAVAVGIDLRHSTVEK